MTREREIQTARRRIEEEPILADLREIGVNVESVWDLVNARTRYLNDLPILAKHLPLPYSVVIRDGIERALAMKQARFAWPILMEEFSKLAGSDDAGKRQAKDGIAVALSVIATKEEIPDIIALAKNP